MLYQNKPNIELEDAKKLSFLVARPLREGGGQVLRREREEVQIY